MRNTWGTVAALLVLLPAGQLSGADKADKFFFQKGDRIVFLGDSITEQYQYSTDIELYLTTRFPKWDLTFLNAGIGGDTATGGAHRFVPHVLAEKPTAITIDFGMNDGGYNNFDKNREAQYIQNTQAMLEAAKKAGVRVALISPNAVDVRARPQLQTYLETQKQFYARLKDLAAKARIPFVDQYAVTRAVLARRDQDNARNVNPFPDGVHTSGQGGLLMAHTILVGLHAPAEVSDVDVDVKADKARTRACTVTNLKSADNRVSFDRTDEALPVPIQKDWLPILPYVKQLKDFNWYGLKVTGLSAAKYTLLIDGKDVATFSADQLAEGVNLGNLTSGPIHDQGQKVLNAIAAKNNIVHQRFRNVVMFTNPPDWLADVAVPRRQLELAKRLKVIATRQAEIYKLVQPVQHHFELKPAK